MRLSDITSHSFKALTQQIEQSRLYTHPSRYLWGKCLSCQSSFCDAVVKAGYLTWEQMLEATCDYCLGITKLGGVIFWQIDQEGRIHDGKVMYYLPDCHRNKRRHPTWVHTLLDKRWHWVDSGSGNYSSHCFFGLHRITSDLEKSICIVEAEKTAVILSQHYPQYIWLAAGGLYELQVKKFHPLRGRKVILFPDTDPDGKTFNYWHAQAQEVMEQIFWEDSPPIRVSAILEEKASSEQKANKIDLVDFLFSSSQKST